MGHRTRCRPALPTASRAPRPLAALGSGRGPLRRAARSGAQRTASAERRELRGLCSRAAGDAPGPRSSQGYNPGGSRGRGAELRLRDGRGGASYGPAEAVSASFAPWVPRLRGCLGAVGGGWASRRGPRPGIPASSGSGPDHLQLPALR